jgi:hypothetical protein
MAYKQTWFISGPVTDIPERNRAAFLEAERAINTAGHITLNPNRIAEALDVFMRADGKEPTWFDYMRATVRALCNADCIYMLPGWRKSRGARIEHFIAHYAFGMPIYTDIDKIPKDW